MKKKRIKATLKVKIKGSKRTGYEKNETHPPRNIITLRVLIRIIAPYSARKNNAKPILAYSTL
jgi:hypothetical protein